MKYINILNELSEHIIIRINSCNNVYHDSEWIENKAHEDYDIWYIKNGKIAVNVEGKTHLASAGDIVFFYPGMLYTAYTYDRKCSFIYTHFDFGIYDNFRVLDKFNLAGIIPGNAVSAEARIFEKGFLNYEKNVSSSAIMLKGCFIILLAKIFEYYSLGNHSKTFYPENVWRLNNTEGLNMLQQVFNYIADNISKPVRIRKLAEVAGMSEKYFINYFKSMLGISPGRYINQLKMNRARDYLYQRKYTIKEISSMLGYPDQYSFSKAFKKHYKVPPSKFVD
ncbi:MAG: helix-turn-helix transcriptional regulator [Firmicutes bacterium]|nr:helix-turn-helix transcriptional regulator [Bacillota bacterium]